VIIEAIPLDTTQFTAQYELLRSQVIGAAGDAPRPALAAQPRGVGLALLLREGMPGWLNAIDAVIRASLAKPTVDAGRPPAPEHSAECGTVPPWPSGVQRQDVTTLLTSLVLSTRRVERSSPREGYRSCQ
jgi:hypothetical protein